ncbi:hypothetical protein SAY86_006060 [Trapa natans]|uniref:CASP-like protein n=2 Tax=Trapa natans TaxID=22666 RepID=A0AAN7QTZ8_TRANT|nr:hypothetical protein SAY86_006060 [Trapa natans]
MSNMILPKVQALLRVVAAAFAVATVAILLTSKQQVLVYGIPLKVQYSYSPAFKLLAYADGVVCGLSALSLILTCLLGSGLKPGSYFTVFLLDLIMALLMTSSCSAAIREGYIAKYGADHMGWMAICPNVPDFCNKITVSIALSCISLVSCFVLTVISAHALMISKA